MKTIYAVTGAGGHLGSFVAQYLIDAGEKVRTLLLASEKVQTEGTDVYYGDVTQIETLRPFLAHEADEKLILIHCAGLISISKHVDLKVYQVNVIGTSNILSVAKEEKVARFVYVSSVHALEEGKKGSLIHETKVFNPSKIIGGYAKTKAEASGNVLAAQSDDFEVVIVHPSGIIGPGFTSKGDFLHYLIASYVNKKLTVGVKGGYDFVDVRDVALGTIAAAQNGRSGEGYILSGSYHTIKEIFDMLAEITGNKRAKHYFPTWLIKGVAWMVELHYKRKRETPLFTAYSMHTLKSNANFSLVKSQEELGYQPRPLRETLEDTVLSIREREKTKVTKDKKKKMKRVNT